MTPLRLIVETAWVGLTGNRLAAVSHALIAGSVTTMVIRDEPLIDITSIAVTALAGVVTAMNGFGRPTLEHYLRASAHILSHGYLRPAYAETIFTNSMKPPRFVQKMREVVEEIPHYELPIRPLRLIANFFNDRLFGYAINQGLYLAAKHHGQLDTYREVEARLSRNIIPNI